MYQVINKQTGAVVATCKTFSGARAARDRRDNAYGAYVHAVRKVQPDGTITGAVNV